MTEYLLQRDLFVCKNCNNFIQYGTCNYGRCRASGKRNHPAVYENETECIIETGEMLWIQKQQ